MQNNTNQKLSFSILLIVLIFFLPHKINGQEEMSGDSIINPVDTTIIAPADTTFHSPRKAVIYSAILPGLGQIYNKKIWKVPIIYAGFGTFAYFINRNDRYYKDLKQALIDFPDYELEFFDPGDYTYEQIERAKNGYKRYKELSIIGTVGFYVLQIIDASVDAYLFDWDVSEDISLHIEPATMYTPYTYSNSFGLRACLSF